jgi:alkylated DNA repair dioxygenase AlkB
MTKQLGFFGEAGQSPGLPSELLYYRQSLFDPTESDTLLLQFIKAIPWKQKLVKMYDRHVLTPRLTAWFGDPGTDYSFSGRVLDPQPWTNELLMIKNKVESISGVLFNSVLLNYYRDGNDSVAWHSDSEAVLGQRPVIASVSFGQVRNFDIRNKNDHSQKYSIRLEHGSYLLMKGDLQENWEHRVAKSTAPMRERVNLTFRKIIGSKGTRSGNL